MANIFGNLFNRISTSNVKASAKSAFTWLKGKAKEVSAGKRTSHSVMRPEIGKMYFFSYDPKQKETLPYYDVYPLIFMVDSAKGGFFGINLHYLHPRQRAVLMDALYDLVSDEKYDRKTRLKLSYNILKSTRKFKLFNPAFKRYLWKHVKSNFIEIESIEWNNAMMLPLEQFKKASKNKVWSDSSK